MYSGGSPSGLSIPAALPIKIIKNMIKNRCVLKWLNLEEFCDKNEGKKKNTCSECSNQITKNYRYTEE